MDGGRKRLACSIAGAAASGAAAAQLSGVARGGERQGSDAAARGNKRPNDPAALSGAAAHHGKVCAHAGSETWHCPFPGGNADASCALKRRWLAATLGKSLSPLSER